MFKKFVCLLLCATIIASTYTYSYAGLQEDINDMFRKWGFSANSADAGVYNAQTMGYLTPGSLSARTKTESYNIYSITPPRFKAGCGGLDMYFGGISFINTQQLLDMLKSIGKNAIGYAFSLALKAICPSCESTIQEYLAKIQRFLKLSVDSCNAAKALVSWLPGTVAESSINSCIESKVNGGSDPVAARQTCLSSNETASYLISEKEKYWGNSTTDTAPSGVSGTSSVTTSTLPGVATWDGLKFSSLSRDEKIYAMSLVGTYVRLMDSSGDGVPSTRLEYRAPTLTFKQFWYGDPEAKCLNPTSDNDVTVEYCKNVTSDNGLPGFSTLVRDKVNLLIDARINNKDLKSVSNGELVNFVNASPIPILALIDSTKDQPDVLNSVVELLIDLFTIDMAYSVCMRLIREAETYIGRQQVVNAKDAIDTIEQVKSNIISEYSSTALVFQARAKAIEITKLFIDSVKAHGNLPIYSTVTAKR